ncbi:hypothetical protein FOCC_FOCC016760 [Frankliniella occidentalis]|nr:hypothetical protein FOCC_FOCC016760 [Frankliniella occidentalis]
MEDGDEETEADEDEPRSDQDEEMDSDGVENSEDDTDVIDSQNDVSWQEWVETGSDEENCDESDDVSLDEYSENYDDESDVEMNSDSDETDFEDNENNESDTEFDSFELNRLALSISGSSERTGATLIRKLGPRLRELDVTSVGDLDALFACLQDAGCSRLEVLELKLKLANLTSGRLWRQEMKLPRLHTVVLSRDSNQPTNATFEALRSLLRAHSGCSEDLHRLEVPAVKRAGMAAVLQRLRGLKELRIYVGTNSYRTDSKLTDFIEFLDSWRRGFQLERLELRMADDETLGALAPDHLAGLRHLDLGLYGVDSRSYRYDPEDLPPSLSALKDLHLPRLRSLVLRYAGLRSIRSFRDISAANIPALELVVVVFTDYPAGIVGEVKMFEELVRRAPMASLHVNMRMAKWSDEVVRICRHPGGANECGLCAEAEALLLADGMSDAIEVEHVEVL